MKKSNLAILVFTGFGLTSNALAENVCFDVQGMTCASCGVTLKLSVKKIDGVLEVRSSVEKKNAVVSFDPKRTSTTAIKKAIDDIGYKATTLECKKVES